MNQIVVELLEGLLEEARTGRLRACAVAIVYTDGATSDRWASGAGLLPASMVGAIEIMRHRYVDRLAQETDEP